MRQIQKYLVIACKLIKFIFFRRIEISTSTEDEDKLIENFQSMELNGNSEDTALKEITGTNTPSSSSSIVSDDKLFENISDTRSITIKKRLLMEKLRELELEEAAMEQRKEMKEFLPSGTSRSTEAIRNKKGELIFCSIDMGDEVEDWYKYDTKQVTLSEDDEKQPSIEETVVQNLKTNEMSWDEAIPHQNEMRIYRSPSRSAIKQAPSVEMQDDPPSIEAMHLIREIRSRSTSKIKLDSKTMRVTPTQLHAQNLERGWIPNELEELKKLEDSDRPRLTTDDQQARLAPSITVRPAPYEAPTFREFLRELGLEREVQEQPEKPLYFVEIRMLSEDALKDLIYKRAEMLVAIKDSKTVTRGTQTYVSHAGKPRVQGCVNCRSCTHHARECNLPYRPGFCQICFADGYDTKNCIYPHGVEHEEVLGLCVGCGQDLSLYCPECPDCNIRYKDIVDWLRLNYATWPSWAIPVDHRYLVNEGTEILEQRVKARFDDPDDTPNRVREFLKRENALSVPPVAANRSIPTKDQLSEEKRELALRALTHPLTNKTLDDIIKERPELDDGAEIKIIIPTKYKHHAGNK